MVTRDKAIKYFTEEILNCRLAPKINGCEMREDWQETIDVCELAIAALREQEEREKPKPLTKDELRKIDREPVWLQHRNVTWYYNGWRIVKGHGDCISICEIPGCSKWLSLDGYGEEWLAYRSKP